MKLNIWPRIRSDPVLKRELTEHAAQVNAISEGRLTGYYNAQSAAPTTGVHAVGDVIRNTAPSELGSPGSAYVLYGWMCVAGGEPGTFVEMRYLTGN